MLPPLICWAVAALSVLVFPVQGAPAENEKRQFGCANPLVRAEWRTLPYQMQQEYIGAVICMLNSPPTSGLPGAMSRYDDFVATHIIQANEVHFVGIFYPYHRLLVAAFELALRVECGYTGAQPYWDWLYDVDDMFMSPIFDPFTGFGGNGEWIPGTMNDPVRDLPITAPVNFPDRSGGGCIPDGPFAGLETSMGPSDNVFWNPHCVRRDFCPETFARLATTLIDALDAPDYGRFERATEPSAHASGHYGVGGLYGAMTDKWASPVDPVFWLHHANVDRLWWSWQARDLPYRLEDISGPLVGLDWSNNWAGNLTLDHPCELVVTGHGMAVGDVMDIAGPLCYVYDTIY